MYLLKEEQTRRKIADTKLYARKIYYGYNGIGASLRKYVIETEDGRELGRVTSHSKRQIVPAGYHEGEGVWRIGDHNYDNLTEAAIRFAERAGLSEEEIMR